LSPKIAEPASAGFFWINILLGGYSMKIKKLIIKLNKAEIEHNLGKAKQLWAKLLKKSLKHKHTQSVI